MTFGDRVDLTKEEGLARLDFVRLRLRFSGGRHDHIGDVRRRA